MTDMRSESQSASGPLNAVSNAMVALHKEQFGRGPTSARSHFAGPDALICVMQDALLPAERAMVAMGEAQRVRESRTWFQVATAPRFIETVEEIVAREVFSFASATDPERGVVMEVFVFHPRASEDGHGVLPVR